MLEQRTGKMKNNGFGLYNVIITGENGQVIAEAEKLTFSRAVCMLEDFMHTRSRRDDDG